MIVYLLEMGSFTSRSLEQDKATKRHGVPKDLHGSDLGAKKKHRAGDQQDVLEDTASVKTNPLPAPTRNTAATLSKKATEALEMRIKGPMRANS